MKYEQLKQKVRKAIKPQCEDCEGKGFNYSEPVQIGESSSNCKTCKGKGYIEELEFGCEVEFSDEYGKRKGKIFELREKGFYITHKGFDGNHELIKSFSFNGSLGNFKNLGKPLTLQEILLALSKNGCTFYHNIENNHFKVGDGVLIDVAQIPLNLTPDQYDEELLEKLIEIL